MASTWVSIKVIRSRQAEIGPVVQRIGVYLIDLTCNSRVRWLYNAQIETARHKHDRSACIAVDFELLMDRCGSTPDAGSKQFVIAINHLFLIANDNPSLEVRLLLPSRDAFVRRAA